MLRAPLGKNARRGHSPSCAAGRPVGAPFGPACKPWTCETKDPPLSTEDVGAILPGLPGKCHVHSEETTVNLF